MGKTVLAEHVFSLHQLYNIADETVANIVSECRKLAQKDYEQMRGDNAGKFICWKFRENCEHNNNNNISNDFTPRL